MAPQEIDDSGGKGIVRIAHDHVRGIGDIGVFCMGGELSQMRNGLFGNKIARSAADEMKRKREIRRSLAQHCRLPFLAVWVASSGRYYITDKRRVPVPIEAPIRLLPQIAFQTIARAPPA